ncbi:MAG TPA: rhodanese-like domain-containing protein, partial [Candidatus Nitrosocosmicus sp.]
MRQDYKNYVTADELKIRLDNKERLMLFDIRDSFDYEQKHIPGSAFVVCNEESKQKIIPLLPKDMDIILVAYDENYPKQISEMMRQIGLNAKYLKDGISSWKWEFDASKPSKDISPKELKMILDSCFSTSNKQQSIFLLDVRQPDQFKQWNIDGSINIPLGTLSLQESLSLIPKDKKIVTICPRGNMSTIAKMALERYGYNVSSLEGGLKAWSFSFENALAEYNGNSKNTKIRLIQFRRIGKGCISYLIDSSGQSIVIDPVHPIDDYVQKAT